jgi:hypothetical protein
MKGSLRMKNQIGKNRFSEKVGFRLLRDFEFQLLDRFLMINALIHFQITFMLFFPDTISYKE